MKKNSLVIAGLFLGLFAWGCGSSDTTTETPAEDGGAGAGGGTAGAGGSTAGAGGGTAGAAGSTAGAGGGTAGAGGGTDTFWEAAYNASGNPSVPSGEHNAGKNCMSCHTGGGAPAWLFAGTMHKADGTTAAPHVEVGIKSGGKLYTAYSGANGNFFLAKGSNTIDFATAEIRIRNATGEKSMVSKTAVAGCNSCHTGAQAMIEP